MVKSLKIYFEVIPSKLDGSDMQDKGKAEVRNDS